MILRLSFFQKWASVLILFGIVALCDGARPCPALAIMPGTLLSCDLPSENRTINCLDENEIIPRGTIAKYKCERDESYSTGFLKCLCKGRWSGLNVFNELMGKCNISDYSVEGPKELNLTSREIRQLFGAESDSSSGKEFLEDGVAYHNLYRKIHHSPALKLNATLSDAAQRWADDQVDKPSIATEDWSKRYYSQNLYRITNPNITDQEAIRLAVAAWYQPAYNYNWEAPSTQSAFTQVVWKSTTDVGFGVAQKGNRTLVVANYFPPGNVVVVNPDINDKWAWFRINVFPPNINNGTSDYTKVITTTPAPNSSTGTTLSTMDMSTTTPSKN